MPSKHDYYEVLGVGRSVGGDDIKRAYRKLALKYHPDNYKGDKAEGETLFKGVSEAYEVLSDPVKRQRYDQFGHEGLRGAGLHDFSNMGFGDIFSMFEDIFSGMGFAGGGRRTQRGYDLETEIELTLEEVATGAESTLEFERVDACDACGGNGSAPGTTPERCGDCGGYGQVQQQVQSVFGMSVRLQPCRRCSGKGVIITDPCDACDGAGRARKQRMLTIQVPPGVRDGQVIRLRGEGEPNADNTHRGDLHVYVRVKDHPLLVRRNDDLICQVPISYSQAALGGSIEVPTLAGVEPVDVPAGTQNGDVITLKGRGLPTQRGSRKGSQHVLVYIEVPKKLSKKQRELLQELAEIEDADVTPQRKTFLEKLKERFGLDG